MPPIVSRIDHLVVPVEDPESLLSLFTEHLGLPVLWPVTNLGPFRSAGVGLGNCWIEIVADAESLTPMYAAHLPAVFRGIAFDSPIPFHEAPGALDEAGIGHEEVYSYSGRRPDGSEGILVTTLPIDGLIANAGVAYLCEMALPVTRERIAARNAKAAAQPAAVGIRGIAEIHIGVRDVAGTASRWTALAGPGDDRGWSFGNGPAVRLKESPIDGITGITVTVDSLDAAATALRSRGLLGPMRATGLGINHAAAHGLDIWLTE